MSQQRFPALQGTEALFTSSGSLHDETRMGYLVVVPGSGFGIDITELFDSVSGALNGRCPAKVGFWRMDQSILFDRRCKRWAYCRLDSLENQYLDVILWLTTLMIAAALTTSWNKTRLN